jgi:hypothetical protein
MPSPTGSAPDRGDSRRREEVRGHVRALRSPRQLTAGRKTACRSGEGGTETCQNPGVAPYSWTVREGSLDGPVVMREYVYDVPDREPVEGQELYLSNGSGPWRVSLLEMVPEVPRSPYNILVVERAD